jgi:hypothetical protein
MSQPQAFIGSSGVTSFNLAVPSCPLTRYTELSCRANQGENPRGAPGKPMRGFITHRVEDPHT